MARAHYSCEILNDRTPKVISIVDQDTGMSVTNDIENVVAEIGQRYNINPDDYLIVYQDSEGVWDGWDNKRQDFVFLRSHTEKEAIERYSRLAHQ